MSTSTPTDRDQQSFAETALRMGGKTEEEARRTGALDKADEQVEALFAPQYQTVNSPVHKAIWDGKTPLALFNPPPHDATHPSDRAIEASYEVVRRRREAGTVLDDKGKLHLDLLRDLGYAGYWGLLIDPRFGGQGVPFYRFTRFLTRMATQDAMVSGMASIHGCIGAVDPLRTFGTPEQKRRSPPRRVTMMSTMTGKAILASIRQQLNLTDYRKTHWEGSFEE